jgi:hypothetical protein
MSYAGFSRRSPKQLQNRLHPRLSSSDRGEAFRLRRRDNRHLNDLHEVSFQADGATVSLRIALGIEPPRGVDAGAQAMEGEVELRLAPAGGSLAVTRSIVLIRSDVERFVTQLHSILGALDGIAVLEHPSDMELRIALDRGKGTLSGFVVMQYPVVKVALEGLATDQSYLSAPLAAIEAVLRRP